MGYICLTKLRQQICESDQSSSLQEQYIKPVECIYHISLIIRQIFFPFQNNSKNLDLTYKMDVDLWDYLGRVKLL